MIKQTSFQYYDEEIIVISTLFHSISQQFLPLTSSLLYEMSQNEIYVYVSYKNLETQLQYHYCINDKKMK